MTLEKYFNKEITNIKSLSLESPEKYREALFDPEKELTNENWRWLSEKLSNAERSRRALNYVWILSRAKTLSPDRFSHKGFSQAILKKIEQELQENAKGKNWNLILQNLADIKIIDTDSFAELRIEDEIFNRAAAYIKSHQLDANPYIWKTYAAEARNLKLTSSRRMKEIDFNATAWRSIKDILTHYRNDWTTPDHWVSFANLAADCRVAFPEKFPTIELNESFWREIKEKLDEYSYDKTTAGFINFLGLAANLKILAAKSVAVTENGLEITMPVKKLSENELFIPERRKF